MTRSVCALSLAVICLLTATATAAAQTPPPAPSDVTTMSLQDLLEVEVVSTASKFPQEVREAPASITVVTADDIRRHGHRTLADVLRSVRGMYTTYDRNYSYIGLRGFARPGDYNTRVLLLVDGHRMNDPIYDMAPIGTEFPIDVSLIQRVEVIRGPGSSLYGTNAFFAVINVVTRTGAERKGFNVESYLGSLDTRGATASFGHLFANKSELLVAGSARGSAGAARLHFPEFEAAGLGDGVAVDLDDDKSSSVFGSLASGRFSVRGGTGRRSKQVPTASFGVAFGDDRETTTDTYGYVSAVYDGPLGAGWLGTMRTSYDYYGYKGTYPFDYGEPGLVVQLDEADSHTFTTDLSVRRRLAQIHLLTLGGEIRNHLRNHQGASDDFGQILDVSQPGTTVGVYVQDEVRVLSWLLLSAGARLDRYPTFGSRISPRGAVVLLPRKQTAVKILHGRAFRAPNAYELYYYTPMRDEDFSLSPETVRSTEVVWEEYVSSRFRTALTAFHYNADHIIEQRSVISGDGNDDLYFANGGGIRGRGVEAEVETKLPGGLSARFSQTYVRTNDQTTGADFSNSPRHLSKASVQIPVKAFYIGVEGQYVGRRLTITGEPIEAFFVPNITLTSPAGRRFELSLSMYNAFDQGYADPGAEEHIPRSIPQDGRTMLAKVRVRF